MHHRVDAILRVRSREIRDRNWMDVSRTKILGRPLQRGNETIIAESCVQVCRERGVLCRRNKFPLAKGHGENWRCQDRDSYENVWQSPARSECEVRDEERR